MSVATLNVVRQYLRRLHLPNVRALADGELLDRFCRYQDENAYTELVRRHGPMVLASCQRVLRHRQDAEDAFQAAFLILARKAHSIRKSQSVAGWLFQVARRLALRARAGGMRRRTLPLSEVAAEPAQADVGRDPLWLPLDEELERLPEQYRSALVLCYLEGRSQAEAARQLAITTDAVNSRLKRARAILRQRLARRGTIVSAGALTTAFTSEYFAAAVPLTLLRVTVAAALRFAAAPATCGASAAALALAQGATMTSTMNKILGSVALIVSLVAAVGIVLSTPAHD